MRDRTELLLRCLCYALAAGLVVELAFAAKRANPLAGVAIPVLPSLPGAKTNAPAGGEGRGQRAEGRGQGPGARGETNAPERGDLTRGGSNAVARVAQGGSNAPGRGLRGISSTNLPTPEMSEAPGTNGASPASTGASNLPPTGGIVATESNAAPAVAVTTNVNRRSARGRLAGSTNSARTNGGAMTATVAGDTNGMTPEVLARMQRGGAVGKNALLASAGAPGTNVSRGRGETNDLAAGRRAGGMAGGGRGAAPLDPPVLARVNKVRDSELFGPVMHPQPIGLAGIAGDYAFLRMPSGQPAMVKEGESQEGIKLVRIGINRVLIEQDGKQSELMIFEGYGGESLMPKPDLSTNSTKPDLTNSSKPVISQ